MVFLAIVELFDPRLMKLLSHLTRTQAWLSPTEISGEFMLDGNRVSTRTVHRWFKVLRDKGGFVYYPYPRANFLGLSDVLLTIHDLRNPAVLGIIPFAASFNMEITLDTGEPIVRQSYWVPATRMRDFREFWKNARDQGFLGEVELHPSRNTHFIFSSFENVITKDGSAVWTRPSENSYFKTLIQRDFDGPFDVRLGELMSEAPLLIPLVVEHIWQHYSSRQVWEAIGQKDVRQVWAYAKGVRAQDLRKPGSAIHLLQSQWDKLMQHFEEVFVQPRVFFDWPSLKNSTFLTAMMNASSSQLMLEALLRMSERSIVTALKPAIDLNGKCHVSCFLPSDQLAAVAKIVGEYHTDSGPPLLTIQDRASTLEFFQPSFCKLDWSCFDPSNLSWNFAADEYLEQLKKLKPNTRTLAVPR